MNKKNTGNRQESSRAHSLPKELTEILFRDFSLSTDDIIHRGIIDRNLNLQFTHGFILLTKKAIWIAISYPLEKEIHCFKGTGNRFEERENKERRWSVNQYPFTKMDGVTVERNVTGGFLLMKNKEGQTTAIAAFSNQYAGKVSHIEKIIKCILDEKEVDPVLLENQEEEGFCPKCGTIYPDPERKICPKCTDQKSIFLRTLAYLKPYKYRIILMFVCFTLSAVLNLVWPLLNGKILYDMVLRKNDDILSFLNLPGGSFVLALVMVVCTMLLTKLTLLLVGILQGILVAGIVPKLVRSFKTDVFRAMGKLSVSFFTRKQTGSLMTRVMDDAEEVSGFFIDGLPYFLVNVFSILATAVIMFMLNPIMALAALLFMPVTFFISWRMLPRLWHRYGRRHRATRSLNAKVNDNLTGARVVKAFGQEEKELRRFRESNSKVRNADMAVLNYDNRFWGVYTSAERFAFLLVSVVGAYLILETGSISLGVLITFTGYVNQMNGPMDFMSFFFRWLTMCNNSAQRMFEIMDAVPEIVEKPDAIHPERIEGTVEMQHVTFGYEKNKPVLKDISIRIESGHTLGIVGRSGAGKTTLVNLISRLYDPQEGSITIDGINIKDLGFAELRGNVAMVSQETYIFMGTVADNIAYAKNNASRAEIVHAAVMASAHDFICKMPDGYDTIIGSSGRELSGGERQRISIARAILADPKILILDEATASVDTETEQSIQASLHYLVQGRTTLSIAHRLSTLKDADYLIVIDDGKIAESGTHEELIAKKGVFYKLKELQTKALALKGIE